jgi:hypothetical protein
MSYRIRPDRAFDGEVHKAAAHQLSKAMAALTDRPQGLQEAVHAARKGIKRLWALYGDSSLRHMRRGAPGIEGDSLRLRLARHGPSFSEKLAQERPPHP